MSTDRLMVASLYLLIPLVLVVGLIGQAPAAWLDVLLSRQSNGALRLAEPVGTLWSGRGQLQLAPARLLASDDAPGSSGRELANTLGESSNHLVLLQTLKWNVRVAVLPLRVLVTVESPQLQGPVGQQPIVLSAEGLQVPDGQLRLPWLDLTQAQGALALARASMSVDLAWHRLFIGSSGVSQQAEANLRLNDVSLGLSPIRPLGSYRLLVKPSSEHAPGVVAGLTWSLASIGDPVLQVDGQGRFDQTLSGHVQMVCRRSCEFVVGLLSVIGRKNGEIYELVLGS